MDKESKIAPLNDYAAAITGNIPANRVSDIHAQLLNLPIKELQLFLTQIHDSSFKHWNTSEIFSHHLLERGMVEQIDLEALKLLHEQVDAQPSRNIGAPTKNNLQLVQETLADAFKHPDPKVLVWWMTTVVKDYGVNPPTLYTTLAKVANNEALTPNDIITHISQLSCLIEPSKCPDQPQKTPYSELNSVGLARHLPDIWAKLSSPPYNRQPWLMPQEDKSIKLDTRAAETFLTVAYADAQTNSTISDPERIRQILLLNALGGQFAGSSPAWLYEQIFNHSSNYHFEKTYHKHSHGALLANRFSCQAWDTTHFRAAEQFIKTQYLLQQHELPSLIDTNWQTLPWNHVNPANENRRGDYHRYRDESTPERFTRHEHPSHLITHYLEKVQLSDIAGRSSQATTAVNDVFSPWLHWLLSDSNIKNTYIAYLSTHLYSLQIDKANSAYDEQNDLPTEAVLNCTSKATINFVRLWPVLGSALAEVKDPSGDNILHYVFKESDFYFWREPFFRKTIEDIIYKHPELLGAVNNKGLTPIEYLSRILKNADKDYPLYLKDEKHQPSITEYLKNLVNKSTHRVLRQGLAEVSSETGFNSEKNKAVRPRI